MNNQEIKAFVSQLTPTQLKFFDTQIQAAFKTQAKKKQAQNNELLKNPKIASLHKEWANIKKNFENLIRNEKFKINLAFEGRIDGTFYEDELEELIFEIADSPGRSVSSLNKLYLEVYDLEINLDCQSKDISRESRDSLIDLCQNGGFDFVPKECHDKFDAFNKSLEKFIFAIQKIAADNSESESLILKEVIK